MGKVIKVFDQDLQAKLTKIKEVVDKSGLHQEKMFKASFACPNIDVEEDSFILYRRTMLSRITNIHTFHEKSKEYVVVLKSNPSEPLILSENASEVLEFMLGFIHPKSQNDSEV
jgi:energy-converting hydrogenase A subunit M